MNISRWVCGILLVSSALSCMQPAAGKAPADSSRSDKPPTSTMESDWAAIVALEDQAKALAKTTGCAHDSQCRAAPVGNRGCGGPRYYIPYCAATTDSVAFFKKLDEVKAAENAFNKKYEIASTCEFRTPPPVGVTAGACAAK